MTTLRRRDYLWQGTSEPWEAFEDISETLYVVYLS